MSIAQIWRGPDVDQNIRATNATHGLTNSIRSGGGDLSEQPDTAAR
jgi:hypothetical protein